MRQVESAIHAGVEEDPEPVIAKDPEAMGDPDHLLDDEIGSLGASVRNSRGVMSEDHGAPAQGGASQAVELGHRGLLALGDEGV